VSSTGSGLSDGRTSKLVSGLEAFLNAEWGRPVRVSNLASSSAGARRSNVLFDAHDGREVVGLVATIMPTSQIQLNPMGAEAALRDLARQAGVPVPRVYATCLDPSYVGGPFFVSGRVEGETVPRRVLRLIHERGIGDLIAAQLGEALGRLHGIDPRLAPTDLLDPGPGNPAEVALQWASDAYGQLLEPRPALALGLRWLERQLPGDLPERSVIHGDVRTGNLIIGPDGLRALLDWESSKRQGDPMEDLAWASLRMWRFRYDELEIGGFANRAPFVAAYRASGRRFDDERFHWWKVLGTLRWALGLAGQTAAHLDGRFVSIVMAASGRRVPELEWDLLMLIRPR
jgi:aminoglycoside phosphotransferase (APT) family kinase protein